MKRKKLYKSDGIKTASPADTLELSDVKKIEQFLIDKGNKNAIRDYTMWALNNNIGLRAMDLLTLPINLLFKNDKVVDHFVIYEQKTNKRRIVELNNKAKSVLQYYYDMNKDILKTKGWNYLFPSQKPKINAQGKKYYDHLTLSAYDKILRKAKNGADIDSYLTVSSHCSRKILGCTLLEHGVPIEQVQALFQHNTPETTLIYTQIRKKYVKELYHQVEI